MAERQKTNGSQSDDASAKPPISADRLWYPGSAETEEANRQTPVSSITQTSSRLGHLLTLQHVQICIVSPTRRSYLSSP